MLQTFAGDNIYMHVSHPDLGSKNWNASTTYGGFGYRTRIQIFILDIFKPNFVTKPETTNLYFSFPSEKECPSHPFLL